MDGWEMLAGIGLLAVVVLLILVITPVMGEVMYYIITNWFNHEINRELYWTGIGLLAVFGIVIYTKAETKDD